MCRVALVSIAAVLAGALAGYGQSAASQIVGCISDPSGASVHEADIQVRNLETGFERHVVSGEDGNYVVPLLPPGVYRISVTRRGFRPFVRSGFRLLVNQTAILNVTLTLGSVIEMVQVKDEEQLVQRATAELGTVIQSKVIADLPLNGRDFQELLALTPGVVGRSVNGQWAAGNLYHLDGVNNTTVLAPAAAVVPILDTIEEFKVQSHNDKAEYGGVLGGIVNMVSRSGTNEAHGSAWEFVRNDMFDARNPFTDSRRPRPPAFRQNQFGAAVGGPVSVPGLYSGTNRTFFNAGFEGHRYRRLDASFSRVPTETELNGNFSQFNRIIFDPATLRWVESRLVREPFPGNRIPASRISATARTAFDLMLDKPNYSGDGFFNRLNELGFTQDRNVYSIKVDHHIGYLDTVWLRYSDSDEFRLSRQSAALSAPWMNRRRNIGLSWTRTLSRNTLSDLRLSHAAQPLRIRNVVGAANGGKYGDVAALVAAGFAEEKLDRFALPNLVLNSPWSNLSFTGDLVQAASQPYSVSANLTWMRRTQLQFGLQAIRTRLANIGRGHHIFFLDAQTGQPDQPGVTGASLASALVGLPASVAYTSGEYQEDFLTWSAYVQGQVGLRRSLTLNWGVRYDQFPTPNFSRGMINTWDMRTGEWLIGARQMPPPCRLSGSAPCIPGDGSLSSIPFGDRIRLADHGPGIRYPIRDNFGPRAGLAWSFMPKAVLRAGYGVFFDTFSATAQDMQNPTETWPDAGEFSKYLNAAGEPLTSLESIEAQPVRLLPAATPWTSAGWFWDPRKKMRVPNSGTSRYKRNIRRT